MLIFFYCIFERIGPQLQLSVFRFCVIFGLRSMEEARERLTTPTATNRLYVDADRTSFLTYSIPLILFILFQIISLILSNFVDILRPAAWPFLPFWGGVLHLPAVFLLSHQYLHCLHSTIRSEFSTPRSYTIQQVTESL